MEKMPKDVRKFGFLKKLKTMKKKVFVLREESPLGLARLEYYDSEKKFYASRAKRSITLNSCFSINTKADAKHKYGLALYTKDDCFVMVADNEEEQKDWLRAMLDLRSYAEAGPMAYPMFEHIWPVTMRDRGLCNKGHVVAGQYRLCLTEKELSFIRLNHEEPDCLFQLESIRRCGHSGDHFLLEVGRSAPTGAGELWMQAEDTVIAQNMHEAILSSMRKNDSSDQPHIRPRRHSSVEKASRPITIVEKAQASRRAAANESSNLPARSNTIGGGDQRSPFGKRHTHTPGKGATKNLLPQRNSSFSMGHSPMGSSPISFNAAEGHRGRTDSMESRGSRSTAGSVSADEVDLLEHLPLTPEGSILENDPYVPMATPREAKISPIQEMDTAEEATTAASPSLSNYMAMTASDTSASGSTATATRITASPLPIVTRSSLACAGGPLQDTGYIDMTPGGTPCFKNFDTSISSSTASPEVTSSTGSVCDNDDNHYFDVSTKSTSLSPGQDMFTIEIGYMDMSVTPSQSSPKAHRNLRPDKVYSYLMDDDQCSLGGDLPKRAYSVGSKAAVLQNPPLSEAYVDMTGTQRDADKVHNPKSSSAPHLNNNKMTSVAVGGGGGSGELGSMGNVCSRQVAGRDRRSGVMEGEDRLMEMDFHLTGQPKMDAQGYLDMRPRASSGGSRDLPFRPRTSSAGQQERGRLGSLGARDVLASLARRLVGGGGGGGASGASTIGAAGSSGAASAVDPSSRTSNVEGHRPRTSTICLDSRPRTSSLGSTDMRPRASSYGAAKLRELRRNPKEGTVRRQGSSDSLRKSNLCKRTSQDSINSVSSEYMDMSNPRSSATPSQALTASFTASEKSGSLSRSTSRLRGSGGGASGGPSSDDSAYLSMDPGGSKSSGGESDYVNAASSAGTPEPRPKRVSESKSSSKSRSRTNSDRSAVTKPSSSTESLTGSTSSQGSEGKGKPVKVDPHHGVLKPPLDANPDSDSGYMDISVGTKAVVASGTGFHHQRSRSEPDQTDESYVLYNPSVTAAPAAAPSSASVTLQKVSSPIRADAEAPKFGSCPMVAGPSGSGGQVGKGVSGVSMSSPRSPAGGGGGRQDDYMSFGGGTASQRASTTDSGSSSGRIELPGSLSARLSTVLDKPLPPSPVTQLAAGGSNASSHAGSKQKAANMSGSSSSHPPGGASASGAPRPLAYGHSTFPRVKPPVSDVNSAYMVLGGHKSPPSAAATPTPASHRVVSLGTTAPTTSDSARVTGSLPSAGGQSRSSSIPTSPTSPVPLSPVSSASSWGKSKQIPKAPTSKKQSGDYMEIDNCPARQDSAPVRASAMMTSSSSSISTGVPPAMAASAARTGPLSINIVKPKPWRSPGNSSGLTTKKSPGLSPTSPKVSPTSPAATVTSPAATMTSPGPPVSSSKRPVRDHEYMEIDMTHKPASGSSSSTAYSLAASSSGVMATQAPKHVGEAFQCDLCGRSFTAADFLERHRFKTHKALCLVEPRRFRCPHCDYSTNYKALMDDHVRIHTGEKPFSCKYCARTFRTKGILNDHERRESGLKPFECDQCGKAFATRTGMGKHVKQVHLKLRTFLCTVESCGKTYSTADLLKRHTAYHTGEKSFKCSFCGKELYTSHQLKLHVHSRHVDDPNKRFPCDVCGKVYRIRESLILHKRARHDAQFMAQREVKRIENSSARERSRAQKKRAKEAEEEAEEGGSGTGTGASKKQGKRGRGKGRGKAKVKVEATEESESEDDTKSRGKTRKRKLKTDPKVTKTRKRGRPSKSSVVTELVTDGPDPEPEESVKEAGETSSDDDVSFGSVSWHSDDSNSNESKAKN